MSRKSKKRLLGHTQLRKSPIQYAKAGAWMRRQLVHTAGCMEARYSEHGCFLGNALPYRKDWYSGPKVSVPRSLRARLGRYVEATEPYQRAR